jgi:general stress protein YciG
MADGPKLRGFAAMTPERRAEVARKGGLAVAPEKRAYAMNTALAETAGRAGGLAGKGRAKPSRSTTAEK